MKSSQSCQSLRAASSIKTIEKSPLKMTHISEDDEVVSPSPYHRPARYGSPASEGENDSFERELDNAGEKAGFSIVP